MDARNRSDQNLLNSLEHISSCATGCNLDFQNITDAADDIKQVSGFLNITAEQVVLFGCLAELSLQRTVTFAGLSRHLKCTILKLLTFMNDFETLEWKGYIQKSYRKRGRRLTYNDMGFSVPHQVIEAIRRSDLTLLEKVSRFDLTGFLRQISDLIDERHDNNLTTDQVIAETEFLISNNNNLPFVSYIDRSLSGTVSKCTAFAISYCRLKGQRYVSIDGFADAVFDELNSMLEFSQQLCSGNHELIKKGIIKLFTSEFDGDKSAFLTQGAAKMLFQTYPDLVFDDPERSGLILHKSIKEKRLFFDDGIVDQVMEIEKVLKPSKLKTYQRELNRSGLSTGITAIFSGDPGTGKTEAVYQIARMTGRDIMMVDLSQTKSKWFGESEKVVRKIFDDYSVLLKDRDVEPILFINEADGFFGRRVELGNRGTTSDQTMNTIQNILLQSLENFNGILIATTNLVGNFDRAFERRFTFKVNFHRPNARTRQKIWKNKLPELTQVEADELGSKFEMTGGDIDVQVRQALLRRLLNPKATMAEILLDGCAKDHGLGVKKKLGFRQH